MPKATPVTLDGITASIRKHAIRLGIPYNTVCGRRMKGDSPEEAFRPVIRPAPVEVDGEILPRIRAAEKIGISDTTLRYRLKKGITPDKPKRESVRYPYKGEMLTIKEIAEREGVSRQAIDQRMGKTKRKKKGGFPGRPPSRFVLDGIEATAMEHAERLGLSRQGVYHRKVVASNGGELRKRGRPKKIKTNAQTETT